MPKIVFPRIGPPLNECTWAAYRYDLSAELASDGIDEWLDRLTVDLVAAPTIAIDNGATIGLVRRHPVDEAGIRLDGDAYTWQAWLERAPL